uniref:HTH cro/C1-type domain-containing protein n=1 Tax=Anaerobacillus isosaccharinicus TaxID=1532552 RepID=A0A1S2MCR3_9BACI
MLKRDKLISVRKENDWLQKDVVNQLETKFDIKISESYYGMIEQGVRTPNLKIALAISELFLVDPQDIFLECNTTKSCVIKSTSA